MRNKELILKLLETDKKSEHRTLFEKNSELLDLDLAEKIKDTCYDSWTKEPSKTQNAAAALSVLAGIFSGDEVRALADWVRGFADLTEGKLERAIKNLDNAAKIFRKIRQEYNAAQTKVAKLIALAMLGKYDEAVETGENALKTFVKYGDEIAAGKIEINIGNLFMRREFPQKAEKYYLSAHGRLSKLKSYEELVMVENGLATAYSALNDFRKAEKFYFRALDRSRKLKMFVRQAEIEASIGNLSLFRGRLKESLNFLESSRQKFEVLEMPHQTAIADLEIADIYLELNLAAEAFEIYRRITPQLAELKIQGEQARSRAQFGQAAILLGEKKTARRELKKAAKLFQKENNSVGAAQVKLAEARFELGEQKYEKAFYLAKESETLLEKTGSKKYILPARYITGESLARLGKIKTAEKILLDILAEADEENYANTIWECLLSLGKIALQKKQTEKAENYFKDAVRQIENLRAPLPAEEFRMAFLANKLEPFEELARICLRKNKIEQAFEYVEATRARTLLEMLGAKTQRTRATDKVSARLWKKLEKLREELNWFYSRSSRADKDKFPELQAKAEIREREITVLMRQINSLGERAEIKTGKLDFTKLQTRLGARRALIEYVCFDGTFSAFIVTDEKIEFLPNLTSEEELDFWVKKLQFQFGAMSYGEKNVKNFAGELIKRTNLCLQKLYEKLIIPLEKFIGVKNLVIVPQKILHYVPFPALFDGKNYLVEKREIVCSPSATVWQFLTKKRTKKSKNALLIGFADEYIPNVTSEIEALQNVFKNSLTFTGEEATFAAFAENAEEFDVLHLACHGQFRPQNPLFSSLHLADGFVTVRDVCSYNLNADLVCLSACETGLSKVAAGEEILGLARGFLSAGANSLLLSLWTVNDEAAMELMKNFYENMQRGASIAASLADAQRIFIKKNAHPYFWSPFVLIGK